MKQLEIITNKRLLIVEYETAQEMEIEYSLYKGIPEADKEIICKGSELTEDIAKRYVRFVGGPWSAYVDYSNEKNWISSALQSFMSSIKSHGYHWGENPEGEQPHNTGLVDSYPTGHPLMDVSLEEAKKWQEAEYRTFNPSKCIIFEII